MNSTFSHKITEFQAGDRVSVHIEDIASMGAGVGRYEGKTVFVPYTCPGDVVTAEIVQNKKKFARARLVSVDKAGDDRVKAGCPYFGECGGCDYQHINYPKEIELKQNQLVHLYKRNGGIELPADVVYEPLSGTEYSYRNRVRFQISEQGLPGFMAGGSNSIVTVEQCPVCVDAINSYLKDFTTPNKSSGQTSPGNEQNSVFGFKNAYFTDEIAIPVLHKKVHFNAKGFFQSNIQVLEKLISQLIEEWKRITAEKRNVAWDLYGGVGLFALFLQDYFSKVVSVEAYPGAKEYALKNGVQKHISAKVEDFLKNEKQAPDLCFVDPPRAGLSEKVVKQLIRLQPSTITYLSCDPATQARDVGLLCEKGGYKVRYVQLVDFYPRTRHMEGLAVLYR